MKQKCAQIIADFLADHGVRHVFTITGGGAMHLNDAFGHHDRLQCIYQHHEQACAIAAEGYARLSGNIACVCVTSGPGGTNAITGVLGGFQDSVPMFVVSGQVKRMTTVNYTDSVLRQLGDQEYQITEAVANMTKYAVMVTEPEEILYILQKAWFLANHGRKGPVWLDIPLDVQSAIVETDGLHKFSEREYEEALTGKNDEFLAEATQQKLPRMQKLILSDSPQWNKDYEAQVLQALSRAKRPVILAGTGIRLAGARDEFIRFIDTLGIPVLTAWNAHDLLGNDHPLNCGRPGSVGDRGGNFVLSCADLVLVLACRMNIRMASYQWESFAKDAVKIVVDIDSTELCKPTVKPDIPIHADVSVFMDNILKAYTQDKINLNMNTDWKDKCRQVCADYPTVLPSYYQSETLNPYVFIDRLFRSLPATSNIVCSNGSACVITFQAAVIKEGQRLFTNSGCAAMGYGFPASIGAYFAGDDSHETVCIEGDGSIQMNLQELQTVVQNKCDIKIIILNNNGYHSIRQTQSNLFRGRELVGVSSESGISFPEFERIAYAYRIPYVRIETLEDTKEKLSQALLENGPVMIEVMVDTAQNFEPKLSSKVLPDQTIVSPPLDDMYPFLDREEYRNVKDMLMGVHD